jgi:hypothetical protein
MAALACVAVLPLAHADGCSNLAGKTLCTTFHYSSGGSNSYSSVFHADGTFTLLEAPSTSGTWTCAGKRGLVDVEYMFSGFEQQSWYARAGKNGLSLKGYGKSISNGYMYDFTSTAGACASLARPPSMRQDLL